MNAVYLQSEFLSLEVINSRVKFTWDVGAGPHHVEHDLPIEAASGKLKEENKWYKVKAKR